MSLRFAGPAGDRSTRDNTWRSYAPPRAFADSLLMLIGADVLTEDLHQDAEPCRGAEMPVYHDRGRGSVLVAASLAFREPAMSRKCMADFEDA